MCAAAFSVSALALIKFSPSFLGIYGRVRQNIADYFVYEKQINRLLRAVSGLGQNITIVKGVNDVWNSRHCGDRRFHYTGL